MLIHELAVLTGLSAHSIRFYEKLGLLSAEHSWRAENNYRRYNPLAAERLILIKRAQAAGFTLNEIRELMHIWATGNLTPEQQRVILQEKLVAVEAKIADLEQMRGYLQSKLTLIDQSFTVEELCQIELDHLSDPELAAIDAGRSAKQPV